MFVYLDNAATTRVDEDVLRVMALFYRILGMQAACTM